MLAALTSRARDNQFYDDRGLAITPAKNMSTPTKEQASSNDVSTPARQLVFNNAPAPVRQGFFRQVWDSATNRFAGALSPMKVSVPATTEDNVLATPVKLTKEQVIEAAARAKRVQAILAKNPERNVGQADKTLAIGLLGGAAAIAANNSSLGQIIRPYADGLFSGVSYLGDLGLSTASRAIGYGSAIAKVAATEIPIPINLATTAPSPINMVASAAAPVAQQTASVISSIIGPANWALLAAAGVLAIGGGYYLYNRRYGKAQVQDATAKMVSAVNQIERTSVAALERISARQDVSPQIANTASNQVIVISDAAAEAKAAIAKARTSQSGADLNRAEQRVLELAIASSQPLASPSSLNRPAAANVALLPSPILPARRRATLEPETMTQKTTRSPGRRSPKTPTKKRRASSPSASKRSPTALKKRSPPRTSPRSATKPKSPPRRRVK